MGKNFYDIIFLDVILPGADGYQVCKHIKKNPLLKQTPVVMLTSKASPFDRVRGSLAGCDTYLTKPVDYQEFKQVLEKYEM
jgi:twitching motility two-component system response regulator PilG